MWQVWLIVMGVCLIIEIMTVGFLIFWLAIGAIFALLASLVTDNIIIQTTIFVISSGLLIFFTRPFVDKFSKKDTTVTNAFAIIGKRGVVLKDINPTTGAGQIKVGSEVWSAKSSDNTAIEEGTDVEIVQIDGVKAIVK